jgi:biotin transport system substrate-specific component
MTTATLRRLGVARLPAAGVVGFAVLLAVASQIAIPVPGTPVPITLQPLVVVLAGLVLGPGAAATSMVMYLAAGIIGLPVFAPVGAPGMMRLLGPTGGYLLAYPAAAATTGLLASRGDGRARRGFTRCVLAAAAGILVLYAGGVGQLTALTGSVPRAMQLGVPPFAVFDALKAVAAATLATGWASRVRR